MRVNEAIDLIAEKLEGRIYGKEFVAKECPYCERTKGKFYINTTTGQFSCKSASCGESGNLNKLLPKLGFADVRIEYDDMPEVKKKEEVKTITVSNVTKLLETHTSVVDDMMARGISYDTLSASNVLYSEKHNALTFLTERDGKTIGCLYRKPGKKIYMESGSEQRLWGIDTFKDDNKTLYLTEGHPDALTLREMGIWNSVSVPNGASSHDWIDRDWEWIKKFEKIILCFDNDEAGRNAITDVKGRLDFANLYELEFGSSKDINDMYMNDCEALFKTVRHPKEISMDGFISLQNVSTEMGVTDELMSTGLAGFDQIFGGIGLHQSTIIVASSGSGKTTIMCNMIKGLLSTGQKVATWSGELSNKMLKTWLYATIGGEQAVTTKEHPFRRNDVVSSILPEFERKIDKAVDGKLFVYDGNKSNGFNMLKHFEYLHKRFGVKYFFVDNLSILDMSVKGLGQYEAESEFSKAVASFTRNNAVHLFLVAHPTKTSINSDPNFIDSKGRVKPIERYTQQQVRGSATLVNLIHNVLVLCRANEHERAFMAQRIEQQLTKNNQQSQIPSAVKKIEDEFSLMAYLVKNRSGGFMHEDALFGYDKKTRRIYGLQTKEQDLKLELINDIKEEDVVVNEEFISEEEFEYDEF